MQNVRAGRAKRAPRTSRPRDLLSGVDGSEIDWEYVPAVLQGLKRGLMPLVYFVGEAGDGHVKIGTALDPVKRLRELQTGNPRRLRIERLIYGDKIHERLLHAYFWEWMVDGKRQGTTTYKPKYAKGTEWFAPDARDRIFTAAEAIWRCQQAVPRTDGGITSEALTKAIGDAMGDLGYMLRREDKMRFLARGLGYVTAKVGQ